MFKFNVWPPQVNEIELAELPEHLNSQVSAGRALASLLVANCAPKDTPKIPQMIDVVMESKTFKERYPHAQKSISSRSGLPAFKSAALSVYENSQAKEVEQ